MKQTSVFRVTGDICFYFAVLNVFSAFSPWRVAMAVFAALCFILGFLIVRCKSVAARAALAAAPGIVFLFFPLSPLLLFPALAWLYYVLVMVRGHYAMPLYEYRRNFSVLLTVCLFFLAANIANATIYRGQVISAYSLGYTFAFLLLGVWAMRRMQMGAEMSLNWQARNALSVVGVPILAVGASMVLFLVFRFSQGALRMVLEPLGRLLLWVFHKLFPDGHSPLEEMTLQEYLQPKTPAVQLELETNNLGTKLPMAEGKTINPMLLDRAAGIGAWLVLGVLLALAFWFVVRYARRNQRPPEEEAEIEEGEAAPSSKRRRGKKAVPILGNARQLRRIYKTYLEFRSTKGLAVSPADTSEEILQRETNEKENEDAERLRQLYIAARYGDPSAVTRDQVMEAQECLERIVNRA